MPAAAKGAEHIDAYDKSATFNKKVITHVWVLTSFLFTPGFRLFRVKKCWKPQLMLPRTNTKKNLANKNFVSPLSLTVF